MPNPSNPEVIVCTVDTWVKVLSEVASATLYKISISPDLYLQTYRLSGNPAPLDNVDAAVLFADGELYAAVSNDVPIDVYVKAVGKDGLIRVDQ